MPRALSLSLNKPQTHSFLPALVRAAGSSGAQEALVDFQIIFLFVFAAVIQSYYLRLEVLGSCLGLHP